VNTDQTVGFYPLHIDIPNNFFPIDSYYSAPIADPGAVLPDDQTQQITSITIQTTPTQDDAIQNFINRRQKNPGLYNLFGRNCASLVEGALKAGGVRVPNTMLPRKLMDYLQQQYWLEKYNVTHVF
jgi:hypothetical protein